MSFGTSGFGGFGQNNQQSNTGFGGFGQTNTSNTGGFGSTTAANTGFGTSNGPGGGLFVQNTSSNTGFGSGGFGSSGFGSKPAFGATTSGPSPFGTTNTTTSNTGFGGFGQNSASTGFGATTGASLFGQQNNQQGGFGTNQQSTGFGGGTSTGFGASSGTTGFGQPANTGFGAATPQNNGTGVTQYDPFVEKDSAAGQQNKFLNITCMPAYQNFSVEELRLVDYQKGLKYGNSNGQGGAFGTSTGFGGFGQNNSTGFGSNTSSTLFGQQNNTNTGGFGQQTNSSGFGTNTGFGNKPSGLFGSTTGNTNQQTTSGFGSSGTTGFGQANTGGFGTSANTTTPAFGGQQNKSLFGSSTGTGFGASTGFGQQNTNTGGSLFGNNNNQTTGFGQPTQQANNAFSGFGQNQNQQNQNQQQSGSSLFGGLGQNNQQKTLFGSTTSGSGPFGQQQQQPQQQSSLFSNLQNQGNSIFGSNQNQSKPLFGSTLQTNTASSNPFGGFGNQNQQNQGNSLLGGQQDQKSSLFGSSNNNTSGGMFSGFGQAGNQQNTNSIFGGSQQQPQNSLFGSTQQSQQTQQQPQLMTTSIGSQNPYGNDHLFVNLATPAQPVGPLATPLSSSQKARKPAPLPAFKLNPAASTRLITPQKRSGYGFSYSTYGTPGSAISNASSPFQGGSLLGRSALGGTLSRSTSMNNLRATYNGEESILNPHAFSPGAMRQAGASHMKRLRINRNLRSDLFGTETNGDSVRPSPLKKTVSFGTDESTELEGPSDTEPNPNNALVRIGEDSDTPTPSAREQGLLRPSRTRSGVSNGSKPSNQPEMEQVTGNQLAVVPEEGAAPPTNSRVLSSATENALLSQKDLPPGAYYMKPTKTELEKMSRRQLSKLKKLVVGRENVGEIVFDEVDLSGIDLDKIMGNIVQLTMRAASVYPDGMLKPDVGKGLNVPALVSLMNSFPRSKGGNLPVFEKKGLRFEKHIERLKRMAGTHFEEYDADRGIWYFRVDHFSRYGLDYDDDDETTVLSPPPDTAESRSPNEQDWMEQDSNPDDTFEFRTHRGIPGAFDDAAVYGERHGSVDGDTAEVQPNAGEDQLNSSVFEDDVQMVGSSFNDAIPPVADVASPTMSKAVPNNERGRQADSPRKAKLIIGGEWTHQLQRTLSPKKQNRDALRETQSNRNRNERSAAVKSVAPPGNAPFQTSIDLMNSLFGQNKVKTASEGKQGMKNMGFQLAYPKQQSNDAGMTEADRAFHESFKPSWAVDGILLHTTTAKLVAKRRSPNRVKRIVSEGRDLIMDEFPEFISLANAGAFERQRDCTDIILDGDIPHAHLNETFSFAEFAQCTQATDPASEHEKLTWELAAILFDDVGSELERKQKFSRFWQRLVVSAASEQLKHKDSEEEKAIVLLTAHDVWRATEALLKGKDYRLATAIAQIGADQSSQDQMNEQIAQWRKNDILSEMSAPIRVLYELLAANTCIAEGKNGPGAENKAETFNISSKFGLNWHQAFGLKLWYGTGLKESIAKAVDLFASDLLSENERAIPLPWFVQQENETDAEGDGRDRREDILWGLLKIYAYRMGESHFIGDLNLGKVISSENVTGTALDARLPFQLYHCLRTYGIFDTDTIDHDEQADMLATDLAFVLSHNPKYLCDAVFVTLHLTSPTARRSGIMALLNRHAAAIGSNAEDEAYRTLTENLKIPEKWLWSAKALFAKAVGRDEVVEVRCLLRAGDVRQAHEVLRRSVAPRLFIEEDFDTLHDLLELCSSFGAANLQEWTMGGGVFTNYIDLVQSLGPAATIGNEEQKELVETLGRNLVDLASMEMSLDERVAVTIMGESVAQLVGKLARDGYQIRDGLERVMTVFGEPHAPLVEDATLQDAMKMNSSYAASAKT